MFSKLAKKSIKEKIALNTREDFLQVDIPGLIQNIWNLSDHAACPRCSLYLNYNIESLKQKWTDKYIDFYFLIDILKKKTRTFLILI